MKDPKLQNMMERVPAIIRALAGGGDVLGAQAVIALNLADYPFPHWAKKEQAEEVEKLMCEAVVKQRDMHWSRLQVRVSTLSEEEKQLLRERELLPDAAVCDSPYVSLIFDRLQTRTAVINGEEHLTVESFVGPDDVQSVDSALCDAYITLDKICAELPEELAWDDEYQYLMSDPLKSGDGMSVGCWISVPGLVQSGQKELMKELAELSDLPYRAAFAMEEREDTDTYRIDLPECGKIPLSQSIPQLRDLVRAIHREEMGQRKKLATRKRCFRQWMERAGADLESARNGEDLGADGTARLLAELRLGINLGKIQFRCAPVNVIKALACALMQTSEAYMHCVADETLPTDPKERRCEYLQKLINERLKIIL